MELIINNNQMQDVEGVNAEFPYVLNYVSGQDTRVPWHWHEEVEFSLVRQGRLRVSIAGRSYCFGTGEGFYINANILHSMQSETPGEDVQWDSHLFHPMFLGGTYRSVFDTKYMAPIILNRNYELVEFRGENDLQKQILKLLNQAQQAQTEKHLEFRVRNIFSDIWLLLTEELAERKQRTKPVIPVCQERMQAMLTFIHKYYGERITLDAIAEAAFISRRECLRCFQSYIQKTPFEYLLEYRVRMAMHYLRNTELTVTQIAMDTGFGSGSYLTKVFRQQQGMTPKEYRNRYK